MTSNQLLKSEVWLKEFVINRVPRRNEKPTNLLMHDVEREKVCRAHELGRFPLRRYLSRHLPMHHSGVLPTDFRSSIGFINCNNGLSNGVSCLEAAQKVSGYDLVPVLTHYAVQRSDSRLLEYSFASRLHFSVCKAGALPPCKLPFEFLSLELKACHLCMQTIVCLRIPWWFSVGNIGKCCVVREYKPWPSPLRRKEWAFFVLLYSLCSIGQQLATY